MKTNKKATPAKKATIKNTNDSTKSKPGKINANISEAEMAETAAKKVAAESAKKPEPPKTTSQYFIDIVRGVRFGWDEEHNRAVRKVEQVKVYADRDLSNEPAERDRLIDEAADRLHDQGWFLCDICCIRETRRQLEAEMDELRNAIEYDKICQCKAARQLDKAVKILRAVRIFEDNVLEVAGKFDGKLPRVLGNRFTDDFVEDPETGKITRKPLPKIQMHRIEGADPKEIIKQIEKAIPKEVFDKICNVVSQTIANEAAPQVKKIDKK